MDSSSVARSTESIALEPRCGGLKPTTMGIASVLAGYLACRFFEAPTG